MTDLGTLAPDADDELNPAFDPLRCGPCLTRGDSCDFHRGLAAGFDLAFILSTPDQDVTL